MFLQWLANTFRNKAPKQRFSSSTKLSIESLERRDVLTPTSFLVATLIVNSLENQGNTITDFYLDYLGRAPDATGFNGWVGQLQQGTAPEAVEASFVGSVEYFANHGGTFQGFLNAIYGDILGRAPDTAGFNGWLSQLQSGALSPLQVALAFTTSVERRTNIISIDYQDFLGRSPEPAAITGWLAQYNLGMNNFGLASNIVGSDEYYLLQNQSNTNFIIAAYQDILIRNPGSNELSFWLNFMATH